MLVANLLMVLSVIGMIILLIDQLWYIHHVHGLRNWFLYEVHYLLSQITKFLKW